MIAAHLVGHSDEHQVAVDWAQDEFGGAMLGNKLRVARLTQMAATLADAPSGTVTHVFTTGAEREGAYRFLGNGGIDTQGISRSIFAATARRAKGEHHVFVPVDGSSLQVADTLGKKGLGIVGTRQKGARGLKVMTAMAVSAQGTTLGLCGQSFWSRSRRKKKHRKQREFKDKETHHWLNVMDQTQETFSGTGVTPWFQLDREADFRELLVWMQSADSLVTVRSRHDRRLADGRRISTALQAAPIADHMAVEVSARTGQAARTAVCALRFCEATLDPMDGAKTGARVGLVLVQECHPPAGLAGLSWTLLTNHQVSSLARAQEVVRGYALRWRVEDFHKTWKSVCGAEDSQLGTAAALIRWCTILAAVAMRIERLKHLARNDPSKPATVELTQQEVSALLLMRQRNKNKPDLSGMPTIKQAVHWIAEWGGYTGKSSGGPPGSITLGRGLVRLQHYVEAFQILKRLGAEKHDQ